MKTFLEYLSEKEDPCWKGYEMVGMKKKGGKMVPNCMPISKEESEPCCDDCKTTLIDENVYRAGSKMYFQYFVNLRERYEAGEYKPQSLADQEILESNLGDFAQFNGQWIPLDQIMYDDHLVEKAEGENKPLNKPMRGGPKKFYVYVKDGDRIKKVTWGDTTGLKVKINDPAARKSFAARHKCSEQNDKTSAAYWACRLPRYAKSLGLSGGGSFFW